MKENNKEDSAFLKEEADRCLQCPKPFCADGCPAGNTPRDFIKHFREGNYEKALELLHNTSYFSLICGYVCDASAQCQGNCILNKAGKPIQIQAIERFLGLQEKTKGVPVKVNGKKIAVIGSGPAGYNAAVRLSLQGFDVTVFEKEEVFGGLPYFGIPEFRLPKKHLKEQVTKAGEVGVKFVKGELFKELSLESLKKNYDAVLLATGYGGCRQLEIKGETLEGVIQWDFLLKEFNLDRKPELGKKVLVIGGGNTAMDSARVAVKFGSDVTVVYRRSREEMPVIATEFTEAEKEGVKFLLLLNPVEFIGKDKLEKVRLEEMELGEETEGRRSVKGKGTFIELEADTVVCAVGQSFSPQVFDDSGVKTDGRKVLVNDNYETSLKGVYAAGDLISRPKTVANAVKQGLEAAEAIVKSLSE